MAGVLADPNDLKRMARGTRIIEQMFPAVPGAGERETARVIRTPSGACRVVLLEPLYGSGAAVALRCIRQPVARLFDVQFVGDMRAAQPFRLRVTLVDGQSVESADISAQATADELSLALQNGWGVGPQDVFVDIGRLTSQAIPQRLRPRPINPTTIDVFRWSLALVGPQFDDTASLVPSTAPSSDCILLSSRSQWRPTREVVEVFDAGLNPDMLRQSGYGASYIPRRYPLPEGSICVAVWSADAGGWLVTGAEPRKFQVT